MACRRWGEGEPDHNRWGGVHPGLGLGPAVTI